MSVGREPTSSVDHGRHVQVVPAVPGTEGYMYVVKES